MSGRPGKRSARSTSSSATTSSRRGSLPRQVRHFAKELDGLLSKVLPKAPGIEVVPLDQRFLIKPKGTGDRPSVPLFIEGEHAGDLAFRYQCLLDSSGTYLAVSESMFALSLANDRKYVIRLEFLRDADRVPAAHVHVHAERGALSHLLSKAEHPTPHAMESLHIPLGGSYLRPSLEDFIQFLINECRFDSLAGWKEHIGDGRERWRRLQLAAMVGRVPSVAVEVLQDLGYQITAPAEPPADSLRALRDW